MKIVTELKKNVELNNDINNVINCFKNMCLTPINGSFEEGYLFETMIEKNSDKNVLYFALTRQFKTDKTEDEYYQIYIDLRYELNDKVKFEQAHWMFDDDRVFDIDKFIKHILKSKEYKYIIKNELKLLNFNVGLNET